MNLVIAVPPVKHTNLIFAWFAIFGSIFTIGYGIQANPFNSWMIESTADNADFMKIITTAAPIGGVFGGIVTLVLATQSPVLAALFVLVGGLLSLAAVLYYIPSVAYREAPAVPKPIPSLRICAQSKEFCTILAVGIFIAAAQNTFGTLNLFMLSTCFGIKREAFVIELALIYVVLGGILGLVFIIACNWILARIDKIRVLVFILIIVIALSIATFFVTLNASTLYVYLAIVVVMSTLAMPVGLIASLFIRDLVVFDAFVTRYNRENMFLTANGIPTNILSSFIGAIPIVVLTLSGFKPNDVDDDHLDNMYSWDATSLWVMRISTSFIVALWTLIAFYLIRQYPLTQKVIDQINKVVKRRELNRETGDLELRNDTSAATAAASAVVSAPLENSTSIADSLVIEDLEDEMKLTNDEREDLLHLSATELYRIHAAIDSQVYRPEQGVYLIKSLLKYGFSCACLTIIVMVVALVFNTIYLDGLFSTILIYFILLVAFYAFYEFFRYTTVRQFLTWDPKELKRKSKIVYEEFTKKGDNLATMLSREGIHVDALTATEEDKEILDLGVAPKSIIANDLKEEDLAEEAFVGLSGYKRIFGSLLILCTLSIILIIICVS